MVWGLWVWSLGLEVYGLRFWLEGFETPKAEALKS